MSVGKVGGGGKGGRAGGPKGAAGAGKAGPGAGFGKVDRSESLVGPSRMSGTGGASGPDGVTAGAMDLQRMLKAGQISGEEATRRLIHKIVKEKASGMLTRSEVLNDKIAKRIADALQADPHLKKALEGVWSKDAEET